MSGIVGILHRDGPSIEVDLLQAMTDFLAYRGPDGREIWSDGEMGLGHADLRTGEERAKDRQPAVLDKFWIAADTHLDSRTELTSKLEQAGRQVEPAVSDSILVLHA